LQAARIGRIFRLEVNPFRRPRLLLALALALAAGAGETSRGWIDSIAARIHADGRPAVEQAHHTSGLPLDDAVYAEPFEDFEDDCSLRTSRDFSGPGGFRQVEIAARSARPATVSRWSARGPPSPVTGMTPARA
jgi:hypothetical protein